MSKSRAKRSLDNELSKNEELNISIVHLIPEIDGAKANSQRRQEIDNLLVQIILAGKKRGRPRKNEGSNDL